MFSKLKYSQWDSIDKNTIAIMLFCIILNSLLGRIEFENAAFNINALTVLDNNNRYLITDSGKNIIIVDKHGKKDKLLSYKELGLSGTASDIQMLNDNNFLIGMEESKSIFKCNIAKRICLTENIQVMKTVMNIFRFRYIPSLNAYYISDTGNHKIIYADMKKNTIVVSEEGQFKYPHEIIYEAKEKIFIVDNNHFKVGVYNNSLGSFEESKLVYETKNSFSDNKFPLDIAKNEKGNIFVTIASFTLFDADVISYNSNGAAINKIPLSEGSQPDSITSFNNQLVIAVPKLFRLMAYDYSLKTTSEFVNDLLSNSLQKSKEEKERFNQMSLVMLIYTLLAGVALIWLAMRMSNENKKIKDNEKYNEKITLPQFN